MGKYINIFLISFFNVPFLLHCNCNLFSLLNPRTNTTLVQDRCKVSECQSIRVNQGFEIVKKKCPMNTKFIMLFLIDVKLTLMSFCIVI